ncbi:MAG TPA: cyanophycin synthetase [Herpetosiphon sp.]|uniref:Cyanophycin synthetase n=1 Tax=Herpetosiphon aurantiacus (strain ATCC 23779 / DSM 785 / 114-95) TaxID=316274 RepID=A9AW27_HERA2|nr:cyanophycin synthetase [Herpetosiphon sp.]ABX03265.1 cyanophycin synthetase [Herpetosiphon aurantiacus DSM 785]HBW52561.1 cyanophycin synthetase [Herpetosiphon sp.]
MKILDTRVYRGPNYWLYKPAINMTVDLEELEAYPTHLLGDFVDRLLALVPSLDDHHCSLGRPGGFVERLRDGTWLGHVMEHLSLELQCLAGTYVTQGKTRGTGQDGQYFVIFQYGQEDVGIEAANLALRLIQFLLPEHLPSAMPAAERATFDLVREKEDLARMAVRLAFGPSTASLVKAAEERGIPWLRLNEHSLVQFGHGKYQKRIQATITSQTSHIGVEVAQDKQLTNKLLEDAGLPVPRQRVVRSAEGAVQAARRLRYPLVVKPLDASHGRGISIGLTTEEEVQVAFAQAQEYRSYVIVEELVPGSDHRVLVINGEVVAVSERVPGHVVGDGQHTVAELVEIVNSDPRRGVGHENVLTKLEIDHQAERCMEKAGVSLETVLEAGQVLYLRSTGNLSTGGTAIDRTDMIHYENAQIAIRAAKIVGLDVAGIDFIIPDISRPVSEVGGGIVEVNAAPGFRMHVAPSEGTPRDAAGPVIDMLFPAGTPSRIPLAALTGTNGKTTTARMTAHILKMAGYHVGMTSTDGIYIDGERVLRGDMTGPKSARMVLRDPTVDAAVLETARGGILREGLGYDEVDVGAILNISADHLGLRGIDTLEEMAKVKSLIIEVIKRDGWAVLNADDPLVAKLVARTRAKPFYFSFDPANPLVREQVQVGGRAIVVEKGVNGDMVTLYDKGRHIPLLWTHLIPATLEGRAKFNVANALAAAALAYSLGISIENIRQGLRTFTTSFYQTPGRLNVFDEHPFRVILDYGHNPAAVSNLIDVVRQLPREGKAICVISVPGDRREVDAREIGRLLGAGVFDQIIIKEDTSLRGRKEGEMPGYIREGLAEAGFAESNIHYTRHEREAIAMALDGAQRGDLVMVFADEPTEAWKQIIYWGKPRDAQSKVGGVI